eukprot:4206659-Prymnesium_polylepis.1
MAVEGHEKLGEREARGEPLGESRGDPFGERPGDAPPGARRRTCRRRSNAWIDPAAHSSLASAAARRAALARRSASPACVCTCDSVALTLASFDETHSTCGP